MSGCYYDVDRRPPPTGKIMNLYLFEYIDDDDRKREEVRAVDSLDAFNAFRAQHPVAPIADVWVQAFRVT